MDAKFVTSYGKYGLNGFVIINYVNLVYFLYKTQRVPLLKL